MAELVTGLPLASAGPFAFPGSVQRVLAEGWFGDPYFHHDKRWFTDGVPTAVVCDDGVDSSDPPPDTRTWKASELDDAVVLRPVMEKVRIIGVSPGWRYPIACYGAAVLALA